MESEQPRKYAIDDAPCRVSETERNASNFSQWFGAHTEDNDKYVNNLEEFMVVGGMQNQMEGTRKEASVSLGRALGNRGCYVAINFTEVLGLIMRERSTGETIVAYLSSRCYVENRFRVAKSLETSVEKILAGLDDHYPEEEWELVEIESHYLLMSQRKIGSANRRYRT